MIFRNRVAASVVGILLCVVSLRVCADDDRAVYVDQDFGFRVEYPKTWQRQDTSLANLRLYVEAPDAEAACFLVAAPAPKSKGFEPGKLVPVFLEGDAFERVLRQIMPEARVLSAQKTRFGNQDAVFAVFSNVFEGATLRVPQKGVTTLTWRHGYAIGGTCMTSPDRFERTVALFKVVLANFLFLQ
jgi:hypothetical protein